VRTENDRRSDGEMKSSIIPFNVGVLVFDVDPLNPCSRHSTETGVSTASEKQARFVPVIYS